jgi:hypothetical protein
MSKPTTYWKARKPLSKSIGAIMDRMGDKHSAGQKLAKELGAKGVYWTSGFTTQYCSGFIFDEAPDTTRFSPMKRAHKGWKPKRIGDGKELWKLMDALADDGVGEIAELIGMNCFTGMGCSTPGVCMVDGTAYLAVPDNVKPRNCTRITDIAYEKATNRKKRAKR